jgi:hypothetical protein
VLAISATGQAELNATVTLHVPAEASNPLFVDQMTIAHRGEQRRPDGVLYPTVHVNYSLFSDAFVPSGSNLQPGLVRIFADHAFVEGADCAGWAANQQGVVRTHSGRFTVSSETRNIAGRDRAVTIVDGDVALDPTLPGGWQGSFCVRLLATDQHGDQRITLALHGAQVRSPRTSTYEIAVSYNDVTVAEDDSVDVTWTAASGVGCATATLRNGSGAQCLFIARLVPDGIVIRIERDETSLAIHVPINTAYCNPDDPLEVSDGCDAGFTQTYWQFTVQVVRRAAPGVLWDDPSNLWGIGSIT